MGSAGLQHFHLGPEKLVEQILVCSGNTDLYVLPSPDSGYLTLCTICFILMGLLLHNLHQIAKYDRHGAFNLEEVFSVQ